MIKKTQGTVHGNTIQLAEHLGLPDGEQVEVTIRQTRQSHKQQWGEGLRRCAGALADTAGLDEDIEQILRERKTAMFREVRE